MRQPPLKSWVRRFCMTSVNPRPWRIFDARASADADPMSCTQIARQGPSPAWRGRVGAGQRIGERGGARRRGRPPLHYSPAEVETVTGGCRILTIGSIFELPKRHVHVILCPIKFTRAYYSGWRFQDPAPPPSKHQPQLCPSRSCCRKSHTVLSQFYKRVYVAVY